MSSLKEYLNTHTHNIPSSAEKFITQCKLHRCILLLIVLDCEGVCVVAVLFIGFMVFVTTTGSLQTVYCCGLQAKRIHKTFPSSIPQPLPLLVEMQHSTYRPLAKINMGPHNAVFKSATLLEDFEFLHSPFVYVTFFSLYVFINTVTSI